MAKKIFENKGTFEALHAAEKWLTDHDYSYGPTQVCAPQAIFRGDCYVSKWRNLSAKDKTEMVGTITGECREGPIIVNLF